MTIQEFHSRLQHQNETPAIDALKSLRALPSGEPTPDGAWSMWGE